MAVKEVVVTKVEAEITGVAMRVSADPLEELAEVPEVLTQIAVIRSEVVVFEGVLFFLVSVCVLQIFV